WLLLYELVDSHEEYKEIMIKMDFKDDQELIYESNIVDYMSEQNGSYNLEMEGEDSLLIDFEMNECFESLKPHFGEEMKFKINEGDELIYNLLSVSSNEKLTLSKMDENDLEVFASSQDENRDDLKYSKFSAEEKVNELLKQKNEYFSVISVGEEKALWEIDSIEKKINLQWVENEKITSEEVNYSFEDEKMTLSKPININSITINEIEINKLENNKVLNLIINHDQADEGYITYSNTPPFGYPHIIDYVQSV